MNASSVSVVIPTYRREQVLLDTVSQVLALDPRPAETLVVDQTPRHQPDIDAALQRWHDEDRIRWLRLREPSIPRAMNRGLLEASSDIVLFLDDDVVPHPGLLGAHAANYADIEISAVVGQVLQPDEEPAPARERVERAAIWRDLDFPFNAIERRRVFNCMAGNLSVRREIAVAVGGFDENFVAVAFRFETEFCRRLIRNGGVLVFDPTASLRHLRSADGGTRVYRSHLNSAGPEHSVGDYYFAFLESQGLERVGFMANRMFRSVRTRYHALHPWWIVPKLIGEVRGFLWARRLVRSGPARLSGDVARSEASHASM